jgi:hypothetical protein
MFCPKRRITITTIDALTDLSALQRDIIIDKTLHGSIVPQQRTVVTAALSRKLRFKTLTCNALNDRIGIEPNC